MKKHKNKIIAGVTVAVLLAFVFWYGGDAPGLRGWMPKTENNITSEQPEEAETDLCDNHKSDAVLSEEKKNADKNEIEESDKTVAKENEVIIVASSPNKDTLQEQSEPEENNDKDKYQTEPVPEGRPVPVEPENAIVSDKKRTCTLSVRCDTIIDNMKWLDKEKAEIVPEDGIIFAEKTVVFYEGESVFNLLFREMKQNKIHMEFENVPIYNSAYIEGIANIYEFDCGELSGWMYKVNGWFPNYGCSRYQLKAGDKVEWVYTCNLGTDVGGHFNAEEKCRDLNGYFNVRERE